MYSMPQMFKQFQQLIRTPYDRGTQNSCAHSITSLIEQIIYPQMSQQQGTIMGDEQMSIVTSAYLKYFPFDQFTADELQKLAELIYSKEDVADQLQQTIKNKLLASEMNASMANRLSMDTLQGLTYAIQDYTYYYCLTQARVTAQQIHQSLKEQKPLLTYPEQLKNEMKRERVRDLIYQLGGNTIDRNASQALSSESKLNRSLPALEQLTGQPISTMPVAELLNWNWQQQVHDYCKASHNWVKISHIVRIQTIAHWYSTYKSSFEQPIETGLGNLLQELVRERSPYRHSIDKLSDKYMLHQFDLNDLGGRLSQLFLEMGNLNTVETSDLPLHVHRYLTEQGLTAHDQPPQTQLSAIMQTLQRLWCYMNDQGEAIEGLHFSHHPGKHNARKKLLSKLKQELHYDEHDCYQLTHNEAINQLTSIREAWWANQPESYNSFYSFNKQLGIHFYSVFSPTYKQKQQNLSQLLQQLNHLLTLKSIPNRDHELSTTVKNVAIQ